MESGERRSISQPRRQFLTQMSAAAMAGSVLSQTSAASESAPPPTASLPQILLGDHRVSRLVVGSNPINGYSYMGPHTDRHMREYFTVDRTVDFLRQCEREGINLFQFSPRDHLLESLTKLRDTGSQLRLICLHSQADDIASIVSKTKPIALVHHGGATDRLFAQGNRQRVLDYVKRAHDEGVMAAVSAHNPDSIKQIADEGWEVDFFMTCFYFLTRKSVPGAAEKMPPLLTLEIVYPFYRDDPLVMTKVIRQVDQPCLAFKILAGGRRCTSQTTVESAFQFAFENIKPTDGVIVGMYPRFYNEIQANAQYVRQFGKTSDDALTARTPL
jgi:hypothetical protein